MKCLILSAGTFKYIRMMISLYESLRKFHKYVYFKFNIIFDDDCINNSQYGRLMKVINKYKYNDSYLLLQIHKKTFQDDTKRRNYSSNIRIKYLYEDFKNYDMIFWMDADSIIKKPLTELFNINNQYKIIIRQEIVDKLNAYDVCLRRQYKSGIIGFRNDESSNYLLKNWYNIINDTGWDYVNWYEDQILLAYLMKKVMLKYNESVFYNLPPTYIDWTLKPDSIIWVGKGNDKENLYK